MIMLKKIEKIDIRKKPIFYEQEVKNRYVISLEKGVEILENQCKYFISNTLTLVSENNKLTNFAII